MTRSTRARRLRTALVTVRLVKARPVAIRLLAVRLAAACLPAILAGAAGGPLAAQEGAAAVQDVTLSDVALPLGGTVFRAPSMTASGTRLSRDELTAILRADAPEPWAARLARLDAGSLTIPVLTTEQAGPGGTRRTATYRDVVARDVRAGRIGELTAAGAALSVAGGPGGASSGGGAGTYGRVRATDLDLAALARLSAPDGDGRGPVQRVYGTVQVADVAYADAAGVTVRIARLDGRELGGRAVPDGWGGALDSLTAGLGRPGRERDRAGGDPEKAAAGPADRRRAAAAAADLIEAGALGNLEMQGLSVSDADPKGPLLLEVGRLAYVDSSTRLDDLAVSRGGVRVRLGRLALSGVSLASTVAGLRAFAAAPGDDPGEDALRRLAPTFEGLTLADLAVDLPPAAVRPPDAARAGRPSQALPAPAPPAAPGGGDGPVAVPSPAARVSLREAALGLGPWRDGVPASARLTLSGLALPAEAMAGAPPLGALAAYGYRDLDLDLVADAAWDAGAREFSLREVSLSGRDVGTLRVSGLVGGVGPELFSGSLPAPTMLMFSAVAKSLDVSVENAGLFERFLAAQSKDLSLKPDELRKEYVTASVLGVPVILGSTPAAKGIGAAMGQFVVKPGRLTLRARAKDAAGVSFLDLGGVRSPASVLDRLDVEAKAN